MESRSLSLILAVAENGVIGRAGGLPWNYPEDRAFFETTTRGHVVIMGRRTWEETGVALPDRINIVVSRRFEPPAGVFTRATLDDALTLAWAMDDEPFIIGGARLFEEALARATRIYLTEIPGTPEGDTRVDLDRSGFHVVSERLTDSTGLRFVVLERALG